MTIISKAALAAELSVSKARVSQYLKSGLPERDDGKLDREAALHWISQNLRSGADHHKGPSRARTLVPTKREAKSHGDPETAVRALIYLMCRVQFYVAGTAVDFGLPAAMAYALADQIHMGLLDAAREHLQRFGDPGLASRFVLDHPDFEKWQPDWAALAERTGEPHDEDAWIDLTDKLMGVE